MCTVTMNKATTVRATFTASLPVSLTIDWTSYLNWEVGRAWQFQTTGSEGTFSDYITGSTTKNGYNVFIEGFSVNWSNELDYGYLGPDGAYYVGYYDGDNTDKDIFYSPPCLFFPNTVVPGKTYTLTCRSGTTTKTAKLTFVLVDGVTVPYGTFNNVVEVTQVSADGTRTNWYAQGVGHIKAYVVKPHKEPREDDLLNITDGNIVRPSD